MIFFQTILNHHAEISIYICIIYFWTRINQLEKKIEVLNTYELKQLQKIDYLDIHRVIRFTERMEEDILSRRDILHLLSQRDIQFEKEFGHLRKDIPQDPP